MKINFIVLIFIFFYAPCYGQWVSMGPGGNSLSAITFTDTDYGWTCGSGGTMWRTINGGTTWEAVTNFETPGSINRLRAIAAPSRSNVITIYETPLNSQPTALYESTNAACTCRVFNNRLEGSFNNFSFRSPNLNVLVGDNGTAMIGSGLAIFGNTPSGTLANLRDGDCPTDDVCYIVGDGGVIRRINATRNGFTAQNSTTSSRLNAVWFTSGTQGCVVGAGGTILRTANGGTTWTKIASPTTVNLYDVRFTNANAGLAVGELGTILVTTDGGLTWRPENSGTIETLYSLATTEDGANIWAAGDGGTVLKRGAIVLAARAAILGQPWGAYPNPFTNALTLDLSQITAKQLLVNLYDATGRSVYQQSLASPARQLVQALALPATLAPGSYLLQLTTEDQRTETRRIVKLP